MIANSARPAPRPNPEALRRRIGGLCQIARWAALAYALWVLAMIFMFWLNGPLVGRRFGLGAEAPLLALRLLGLGLNLAAWGLIAAAAWSAWRLFSAWLQGLIFTPETARRLQMIGVYGLSALMFDMVFCRPLITWLIAGKLGLAWLVRPDDLLQATFLIALAVIGHVLKLAAEMADDNATIV